MEIQNLYPGSWGSNCYLLTVGAHAAVVDPSADAKSIVAVLQSKGLSLEAILLTHGHFDHIVSVDTLREQTGAPLCIHREDGEMLPDSRKNAFHTFFRMERRYREAERLLEHGDEIRLGDEIIRVLSTPGHSKGSICLLCNNELLITGDTLFAEGYGRYDLYGGDAEQLFASLASLRTLPRDLTIYPGHGAPAKLGTALDHTIY